LEPTHRNAGPATLGEPSGSKRNATISREPFHASPGTPGLLPCIGTALAQLEARDFGAEQRPKADCEATGWSGVIL
jgi:hypothetical protein